LVRLWVVGLLWFCGVSGPLTPDPSPPFHGGEGRILWSVFGFRFSLGEPQTGVCGCWYWRSVMLVAVLVQLWVVGLLWFCGVSGPLTPDPSPPFHGGEGRILCSVIGFRCSLGEPQTGVCGCEYWRTVMLVAALVRLWVVGLLWFFGVDGPLTPDPSRPFHGGEGRIGAEEKF